MKRTMLSAGLLALVWLVGCERTRPVAAVVDAGRDAGPAVVAAPAGDDAACTTGGDLAACRRAALVHIEARRDAQALAHATRACDGGYLLGCRTLGWLHENGRGTARDAARARVLYGRACDGGETGSCKSLGVLWDMGQGGAVDRARAAGLYERACTAGEMGACHNLANLLLGGDGVPRDLGRAAQLYTRVCAAEPGSRACEHARRLQDAGAGLRDGGA